MQDFVTNPRPGVHTRAKEIVHYFVRFDIALVGTRPVRIDVVGHLAKWTSGTPVPIELHGGDVPDWSAEYTDALVIAIHDKLGPYVVPR